jgi:hypothetical protein
MSTSRPHFPLIGLPLTAQVLLKGQRPRWASIRNRVSLCLSGFMVLCCSNRHS